MNKTLLLILGFIVLFACKKEETLPNLNSDGLEQHLPISNFEDYSKVVFVDEYKNEMILNIELSNEFSQAHFNGKLYRTNNIILSYKNSSTETILIQVSTTNQYISNSVTKGNVRINSSLSYYVTDFPSFFNPIGFDENGIPAGNTVIEKNVALLDKSFKEVYTNLKIDDSSFVQPEIFYNKTYGIIGFRDSNRILWVFKEYIK